VLGRDTPLEVYGPPGLERMTTKILEAYSEDIEVRLKGNQPSNDPGIHIDAHDVKPGLVYEDANVKVTAFAVKHGAWKHAYGYRFDAADRSIVLTGDTVPQESVVEACDGCDVLVHEVYSQKGFDSREEEWQAYHKISHTSGPDLGDIAARAKPKLLVLYHQLLWGATPDDLLAEVREHFDGEVVYANDLDVF
jgi:ribonuclease Z